MAWLLRRGRMAATVERECKRATRKQRIHCDVAMFYRPARKLYNPFRIHPAHLYLINRRVGMISRRLGIAMKVARRVAHSEGLAIEDVVILRRPPAAGALWDCRLSVCTLRRRRQCRKTISAVPPASVRARASLPARLVPEATLCRCSSRQTRSRCSTAAPLRPR